METGPVKIYTSGNSPRLVYIAGFILGDILGLRWDITNDRRRLGKHPVINYSDEKVSGSFKISPDRLLFETSVQPSEIVINDWKGLPVFFGTSPDSDLPFDIFAASFYLISRYEEYVEYTPDLHGRYPASASLAYRNGFLDKPVVDLWVKEFARVLLKKIPTLVFRRNEFKALLTVDSDEPFANPGHSIFKSIGELFHDKTAKPKPVKDKSASSPKTDKDPYDVYDYILETIDKNATDVRFFFPVGDQSRYDRNPSWRNDEYRKLILKIAGKHQAGLHPSYSAGGVNDGVLMTEAKRFKTILKRDVSLSRFHYLRLSMPGSYRSIIKAGISEDFSMGYPEEPGFRAGIARPFCFYDLREERPSTLRITPFVVMDSTLHEYKKLGPETSRLLISKFIDEIKNARGLFVSIWHNTSLLENDEGKSWREVFEFMMREQRS